METIKDHKIAIIFVILLTILFVFYWQNSNETIEQNSPKETVYNFIQADMAGARLGFQFSQNTPNIFSYTSWQGAPGYDEWMVIDDYTIRESEIQENKAKTEVKFTCLAGNLEYNSEGEIAGIEKCASETETVVFSLEKINDQWKIASPHIIPHISRDTALKFFELNNMDMVGLDY